MCERAKRIVSLALLDKKAPDTSCNEASSDHDAFSSDSDTEYLPSSVSLDSRSTNYSDSVYDFKDESEKDLRYKYSKTSMTELPGSNTTEISKLDKDIYNYCEPFEFEYDNDFKGECLFDDETIAKFTNYFEKGKGTKKRDVYKSPFLKINKYKKTICKFCESPIISKHFARHLERQHNYEKQVKELLALKPGSKQRKQYIELIRNEGNLDNAVRGRIIPKKRNIYEEANDKDYVICVHCKGYYKRLSYSRHVKKCFAKQPDCHNVSNVRPLAESLTFAACQKKYGEILNKLNVKKDIFSKMQADEITKAAIGDILIVYFGEDLLKKSKMKRSFYHISNRIRECARFLIEMKKLGSCNDMLSVLKPENFDIAIDAVKFMAKYNASTRSFGAASLALHFRTTLTALCDLSSKLILRKKIPNFLANVDETLKSLERFKNLVESQWATEIGSLALKDLNEKSSTKPKYLPVTEDIIKLAKLVEEKADEAYKKLSLSKDIDSYKILSETILVFTVLHNRKRVGDVQYLEWKSCKEQLQNDNTILQTELAASLSETEKILTQNYKKIVSIGKGSRPVTILIPKKMLKYFSMLCKLRNESWFPPENSYLFTYPKSTHWIDGCSVIRKYALQSKAKYPQLLTSSRLRKHIATVTQLLSLRENEIDQLAKFMGHTKATHETFYKLPQDVFQIAKVSKILQIMEKGNAAQFKNKSLEEIEIDFEKADIDQDELTINAVPELPRPASLEEEIDTDLHEKDRNGTHENSEDIGLVLEKKNTLIQKKGSRQKWANSQKNTMKKYFQSEIKQKRALRKEQCENFIKQHKSDFVGVHWIRIKTFIFNEYQKNS